MSSASDIANVRNNGRPPEDQTHLAEVGWNQFPLQLEPAIRYPSAHVSLEPPPESFYVRNMSNYQDIDLAALAQIFRALANPHRLRVLLMLADCCGPRNFSECEARACVGDICSELGIAPSTVSHHLKELRQAGLIHTARNGQNVECWVDPDSIQTLLTFLHEAGRDDMFAAQGSGSIKDEDARR